MEYFGEIMTHYILLALREAGVSISEDMHTEIQAALERLQDTFTHHEKMITELEDRIQEVEHELSFDK